MEEDILDSPAELLAKQHRREKKDLQGIENYRLLVMWDLWKNSCISLCLFSTIW